MAADLYVSGAGPGGEGTDSGSEGSGGEWRRRRGDGVSDASGGRGACGRAALAKSRFGGGPTAPRGRRTASIPSPRRRPGRTTLVRNAPEIGPTRSGVAVTAEQTERERAVVVARRRR